LPVIDDPQASQHGNEVTRVVLCSGKIFIDLVTDELRQANPQVALVRLEQLYPFRPDDLAEVLDKYPHLKEIVWVQEEPRNMGAWIYLEPLLLQLINGRWSLEYLGRPASASPAEGSFAWHSLNQKEIITKAYQSK
jgi:2-oxoglutarate dehydrogenase E1 component